MSGNVFALGRFGIAVLLIIGGIAAIYWGYQLFLHGSGLSKGVDKLDFKSDWGKVSFAGMSVGGALMVTSVFWGGFAYLSVPKLEMAGDFTKITHSPVSTDNWSSAVASAVGATIVDKDKATLGTITDVIMASPTQAAGYVVDLAGNKNWDVFLGANAVTFGKSGTATVNLTSDQFLNLKPISKSAHDKKWELQLIK
jgi:hypothetical protein